MNKYEIKRRIKELEEEIKNFELDPDDYEKEFDEYFDEIYEPVRFGQIKYSPAQVLKCVDPIAYREALLGYINGIDLSEVEEYQALVDELNDLRYELEEIENAE